MRGAPSAVPQDTAAARVRWTLRTGKPCQSRAPAACRHPYPSRHDALTWLCAQTDARCRLGDYPSFVRRALSVLGWTGSRIVAAGIADDTSAGLALTLAAREWLLAGAPAAMGHVWDRIHSALMHRAIPETGKHARGNGWWYAFTVSSIPRLINATKSLHTRSRLRTAFRCLPPAVQWCIWTQSFFGV